jgi:hypothetical protein
MKKLKTLLFVALTAAVIAPSCKKGADDPFLSLRSRKARVAGEWKVDAKVDERTTTLINPSINTTATETITINGSSYTKVYKDASGSDTQTGTVGENTYTFDKDGTWSAVYELTTVVVLGSVSPTTETTVNKIESSGIWNFLGKIGDAKNKENMSVSTTSKKTTRTTTSVSPFTGTDVVTSTATETFAENEEVQIWKLTELRNKELKAEIEIDNSTISTSSGSSSSSTQKVSGSISITLKQ